MILLCPRCAGNTFVIRIDIKGNLIAYACYNCFFEFKDLKTREKVN